MVARNWHSVSELTQHETKHGDGLGVLFGRKPHRGLRSEINISQNALFSDLAANQVPGLSNELSLWTDASCSAASGTR